MNTDPATQVAARVRAHIATLPVPPAPPFAPPAQRRRPAARLAPVAAALAIAAVMLLTFAPWGGGTAPVLAGDRPVTMPDRWAGYSHFTGNVSQSPPGPALAVYLHGFGVELFDFPQALVLSAYSDVYRRVDLADDREDGQDQGDPAPMLLSPDGRLLAVGSHNGLGNLALLDLSTGRVAKTLGAGEGKGVRPLAWSRDGRRIAALELPDSAQVQTGTGDLVIFDVNAGTVKRLTQHHDVSKASFSPDGTELAIQGGVDNAWTPSEGDGVRVVDLDGNILRTLTTTGVLSTESAWSPDGSLIAVTVATGHDPNSRFPNRFSVVFFDARGGGGDPISLASEGSMVGWTGNYRVLLMMPGPDNPLQEVNIATRQERLVSRFDTGPGDGFGMGRPQFASNLLLDIQIRPAGSPDRGPLPKWLQGTINMTLLGAGFLIWYAIKRRMRGRLQRLAKMTAQVRSSARAIAP